MSVHPPSRTSSTGQQPSPDARSPTLYQPLVPQQASQQSFKIPRKPVQLPLIHSEELNHKERASFKAHTAKSQLLATFFSVVGLVAIVIVLKVYQGQRIEDLNLPRYLTLNGLIAAIATFDRVFLVVPIGSALSQEAWLWFAQNDGQPHCRSRLRDPDRSDAATRGAWGSFLFMFTSPRRYLSLFGALITIFSLAISTFTQQPIVVKNIPLNDPNSSLQPGNLPRTEYYDSYTGNPSEGPLSVPLNMTAAVYNGFMSTTVDPILANCSSGNCTWPLTPSLAVCGACAPILPLYTHCNSTFCNFTMPSGSVFQLANFSATVEGQGFQTMYSNGQHRNVTTGGRLYLANFDMMGAIYNHRGPTSRFDDMMNATECALWMCVNQYNNSIVLGKQTETIVSSFDNTHWQLYNDWSLNFTFEYPNTTAGAERGSYTNYTVHPFAANALRDQFSGKLNGTVWLDTNAHVSSSDVTQAMWAGTVDLDQWIQNVTTSMSNIVRPSNYLSRDIYEGTAYVQAVTVEWWWLSLPVVSVVGSTLLLLTVMIKTARSSVKPWRGNPLTLLFMEIYPEIKRIATIAPIEDGGESGLGEQKVTLGRADEGAWRLKSHQA